LPEGLGAEDVKDLLGSCDRTTAIGCRDHAMLALLVRLGLRAGEVAAMQLGDMDWRAGELVVHGKGWGAGTRRCRCPSTWAGPSPST
jgi:integrase